MSSLIDFIEDEKISYLPSVDVNDLEIVEYKNTWIRKGFGVDKSMVKDSQTHYSLFDLDENSIVLDLGANIGGFTRMATSQNIKQYIGVEPDPENMAVAKKNAENATCDVVWYEGAASVGNEVALTFFQNSSNNSKCSGTIDSTSNTARRKGVTSYNVRNYNLYEMMEKYKPTHVKVDIEGAEIPWLLDCKGVFPDHIQQMSFEVHKARGLNTYSEYFDRIEEDFEHIKITPNVGFPGGSLEAFPKLGIHWEGRVWAADIFLQRK